MSDMSIQSPPSQPPAGKKPGGAWIWDPATKQYVYLEPGIDFGALAANTPADWKQAAKEIYGGLFAIIEGNAELEGLLQQAVGPPAWTKEKFLAKLYETNWWKSNSDTVRQWDINKQIDPETARRKIDSQIAIVRQTALGMGVTLSEGALATLAENSLRLGYNEVQLSNAIGSEASRSTGSQLAQGYYGDQIREVANNYGIPISESTLTQWSADIASGKQSVQTFETWAKQMAKNMFPSLADGFDKGLTFKSMSEPYAQFASQLLEIPTSQMNFTDPKWAAAFTQKDEKGNPTTMSYGAWLDYLRSDPSFGWEYTDNARNTAYDVALQLGQLFGRA